MRKSMRVATVFTGTAALTAGFGVAGFGPAAMATQASHIESTNNCTTANKNWAEVSVKSDPFNRRVCSAFGFRGITQIQAIENGGFDGIDYIGQCGGNNYGNFPWIGAHSSGILTFSPGTTFRNITYMRSKISNAGNDIRISGWTGHDQCP
jgi:hypothetical protein